MPDLPKTSPPKPDPDPQRQLARDEIGGDRSYQPLRLPTWPPDWPEIAVSVARSIERGDWGRYRGQSTTELTNRIGQRCAVSHCRLVASGSLGVELALRACGIGNQHCVAICGYDYPGNFRAVELLGARPVLVDVDPNGYSIDAAQLQLLDAADIQAVIVSHLYGLAAEIQVIRQICDRNGWRLVEDACQTPMMTIGGRAAGTWGDVGVLSFGGSKPLTAGNGGAVLTNDDQIASRLNAWIDRPSDSTAISELQAAALLPQLDRLQACNQTRRETACAILDQVRWIRDAMGNRIPDPNATLYKLAWMSDRRDQLIMKMADSAVPAGTGYRAMHRSSNRRCGKLGDLGGCRILDEQACLLDHSALLATGAERENLIRTLIEIGPG